MRPTYRICEICGSQFLTSQHLQKYCCFGCRQIASKNWNKAYYAKNKEKRNEYNRKYEQEHLYKWREYTRNYRIKNRKIVCSELCGRPIHSKFKTHEKCLVNQALELLKKSEPINEKLYYRLLNRGYHVADLKKMLKEN